MKISLLTHKINGLLLLLFLSTTCMASTQKVTNEIFSIDLPTEMKQTLKKQNQNKTINQFVFQAPPLGDYSPKQIRITAVAKAPKNSAELDDWNTKILGANIAMFIFSYHLDLSNQSDVLGKKPEKLKLGQQIFTAATMTFDAMQTYFLVTTTKNATYNIILISIDNNSNLRKDRMKSLLESIKTMHYK